MKHQYFGDIHDFKKYTLLNWFINECDKRLLIAWYLTNNDDSDDGKKLEYLKENEFFNNKNIGKCYKKLFDFLKKKHTKKNLEIIENSSKLIGKNVGFFKNNLDECKDRKKWFDELKLAVQNYDIVFADPDNGIKFNDEASTKHIRLSEIKELWKMEKSLIIYQHFPRFDREVIMAGIIYKLYKNLKEIKEPFISVIYSSDIAFIFILEDKYIKCFENIKYKLFQCKDVNFLNVFDFTSKNLKNDTI